MADGEYGSILGHRKMPSHDWAKKNTGNLEAVAKVAEAEQNLIEAIDIREAQAGSRVALSKQTADNMVNTALRDLAFTYLSQGVAEDADSANRQAKRAVRTIKHCLDHESVTTARQDDRGSWSAKSIVSSGLASISCRCREKLPHLPVGCVASISRSDSPV
jgi:hypothetical protein